MTLVATLLAVALLVLAVALGLHCIVMHCDRTPKLEIRRESDRS